MEGFNVKSSVGLGWFGSPWEPCTLDGGAFKSSRAKYQTSEKASSHWNRQACKRGTLVSCKIQTSCNICFEF
jgi:hypothetical protein